MTQQWVHCPICGGKTRTKIREDTVAKNLPIFCKICKNEFVMDIKDLKCEVVEK
ncbi:MAG: conjugal transfer protein [Lachnospiraceae bacterium]|nr:conjugal transfer protein [Lachnospiraceae bacterium]